MYETGRHLLGNGINRLIRSHVSGMQTLIKTYFAKKIPTTCDQD